MTDRGLDLSYLSTSESSRFSSVDSTLSTTVSNHPERRLSTPLGIPSVRVLDPEELREIEQDIANVQVLLPSSSFDSPDWQSIVVTQTELSCMGPVIDEVEETFKMNEYPSNCGQPSSSRAVDVERLGQSSQRREQFDGALLTPYLAIVTPKDRSSTVRPLDPTPNDSETRDTHTHRLIPRELPRILRSRSHVPSPFLPEDLESGNDLPLYIIPHDGSRMVNHAQTSAVYNHSSQDDGYESTSESSLRRAAFEDVIYYCGDHLKEWSYAITKIEQHLSKHKCKAGILRQMIYTSHICSKCKDPFRTQDALDDHVLGHNEPAGTNTRRKKPSSVRKTSAKKNSGRIATSESETMVDQVGNPSFVPLRPRSSGLKAEDAIVVSDEEIDPSPITLPPSPHLSSPEIPLLTAPPLNNWDLPSLEILLPSPKRGSRSPRTFLESSTTEPRSDSPISELIKASEISEAHEKEHAFLTQGLLSAALVTSSDSTTNTIDVVAMNSVQSNCSSSSSVVEVDRALLPQSISKLIGSDLVTSLVQRGDDVSEALSDLSSASPSARTHTFTTPGARSPVTPKRTHSKIKSSRRLSNRPTSITSSQETVILEPIYFCSKCPEAEMIKRENFDSHLERKMCGGALVENLTTRSKECTCCHSKFLTQSELQAHSCVQEARDVFDSPSPPPDVPDNDDGSPIDTAIESSNSPLSIGTTLISDDLQLKTVSEQVLLNKTVPGFACSKCRKDESSTVGLFLSLKAIERHFAAKSNCGGQAMSIQLKPYRVCDCQKAWYTSKDYKTHYTLQHKYSEKVKVPRPNKSPKTVKGKAKAKVNRSFSSDDEDSSDGEEAPGPAPEEVVYSEWGRPQRRAGLHAKDAIKRTPDVLSQLVSPALKRKRSTSNVASVAPPKRPRASAPKEKDPVVEERQPPDMFVSEDIRVEGTTLAIPRTLTSSLSENVTVSKAGKRRNSNENETQSPLSKRSKSDDRSFHVTVQDRSCQHVRPMPKSLCMHCRRRKGGDTCRFIGVRELKLTKEGYQVVGFRSNDTEAPIVLPSEWSTSSIWPQHLHSLKRAIAISLLPLLKSEQTHVMQANVLRRSRELSVRATCDSCMTSIFSGCWMCKCCGRELCSDCFESLGAFDHEAPKEGEERRIVRARRNGSTREEALHRRLVLCEFSKAHYRVDFIPVSRFDSATLERMIEDMEVVASLPPEGDVSATNTGLDDLRPTLFPKSVPPDLDIEQLPVNPFCDDAAATPDAIHRLIRPPDATGIESLPLRVYHEKDLNEDRFRTIWAQGKPLVVTDLLPKFKIRWDPQYFIQNHGQERCLIVECQSGDEMESTVAAFFKDFGNYGHRPDVLKLKDWPPTEDFKTSFPDLFEDFSQAVPIPNYTRRDGILNMASHFPLNAVAPDIGPKMYNAFESSEDPGGKGSTRLHMDMADAVNVMLHASPRRDGTPGYAAWNIFQAEDSNHIREFLREHFPAEDGIDPIHSQLHFLDVQLRQLLFQEKGVRSWRINQRPGEAVFIPAGCAHQVCNVGDCIKVAVDFVSPENVERCSTLTREFREQNQAEAWKEDVLQLRTMMWYAWLSCQRFTSETALGSLELAKVKGLYEPLDEDIFPSDLEEVAKSEESK